VLSTVCTKALASLRMSLWVAMACLSQAMKCSADGAVACSCSGGIGSISTGAGGVCTSDAGGACVGSISVISSSIAFAGAGATGSVTIAGVLDADIGSDTSGEAVPALDTAPDRSSKSSPRLRF